MIVEPDTVLRAGIGQVFGSIDAGESCLRAVGTRFRSRFSLLRWMSEENLLWGAPRIYGELLRLGIEVAQSTVAKYMARRQPWSGQTWKTFLRIHAAGLGATDFLVVPTINFRLLSVLVILRHERRLLISAR